MKRTETTNIYNHELQNILTQQVSKYPELNRLNILDKYGILVLPREQLKRIYFSDINNISVTNLRNETERLHKRLPSIERYLPLLRDNFSKVGLSFGSNMDHFMYLSPKKAFNRLEVPPQLEKQYYMAYFLTLLEAFEEPNMGVGYKRNRKNSRKKNKKNKKRRTKRIQK